MQRAPSRGAISDLARATKEQREAELALKRLECRVQQLSFTNAHEDNRRKKQTEVAERHEQVKQLKEMGKKALDLRKAAEAAAIQRLHEDEEARRKSVRNSMMGVFSGKIDEVQLVKERWRASLKAHHDEEEKWTATIREAAQDERRKAFERRHKLIASLQDSRARAREEVLRTSQTLKQLTSSGESEVESLRQRALEQRQASRDAIRRAREAIETRNSSTRAELVSKLTDTRAAEISRIKSRISELEEEQATLQCQRKI